MIAAGKNALLSLIFQLLILSPHLAAEIEAKDKDSGEAKESEEVTIIHNPGIVALRDGKWLWSDHLLNIGSNISVKVELAFQETIKSSVTAEELEGEIAKIFQKEGITPFATPLAGMPDLPAFHLLILAYPIQDKGYAYSIAARLFEAVQLDRIRLDKSVTMLAITWERSSIHIVSKESFSKDLQESVKEVAVQFAERFNFFKKLENSSKR